MKMPFQAPLVSHIYTADTSAHVFNGRIYIYPSHDIDSDAAFDDLGSQFAMEDYHVLSMDRPGSEVIDHGCTFLALLERFGWSTALQNP